MNKWKSKYVDHMYGPQIQEQKKITSVQSSPDIWKDLKQRKEACFATLFQEEHSDPSYQLT